MFFERKLRDFFSDVHGMELVPFKEKFFSYIRDVELPICIKERVEDVYLI
jgi:hypothetical protein